MDMCVSIKISLYEMVSYSLAGKYWSRVWIIIPANGQCCSVVSVASMFLVGNSKSPKSAIGIVSLWLDLVKKSGHAGFSQSS